MRKFVMAAVAASFVTVSAPAFASESSHCAGLDGHGQTRFNPTELSAYQECWLDAHKPGETAGVLGSIFWAKAGDNFVSMPVSELRSAGSSEAARRVVVEAIVDTMRIEELEAQVETLEMLKAAVEAERDGLIADLATATADIAAKAARIGELNATIAAFDVTIDNAQAIADATPGIEAAARVGYVTEAARDTAVASVTLDRDEAIYGNTAVRVILTNGTRIVFYNETGSAFRAVIDHYNTAAISAAKSAATDAFAAGTHDTTAFDAHVDRTADLANNSVVAARQAPFNLSVYIDDNLVAFGTRLSEMHAAGLVTAINTAVDAAYTDGYNDGYADGYTDGYADGFADGVASVN